MSTYLNELCIFYDRMIGNSDSGMPPIGMSAEKISFALVLSQNGDLVGVEDLRDSKGMPIILFVPSAVSRSGNAAPNFLWDNTSFTLGVDEKKNQELIKKYAESFKTFHQNKLGNCSSPQAMALLNFLDKWDVEAYKNIDNSQAMLSKNIVFKLEGDNHYLHETNELKEIWLKSLNGNKNKSNKNVCLISGKLSPIALIHPVIKGVEGAHTSGARLISFKWPAFTSYGKQKGTNAPVSEDRSRAYTTALNYLLQREHKQMVQIADTCIVFWADKACEVEKQGKHPMTSL